MTTPPRDRRALQRALLVSGVLSSIVYVIADIVGGLIYPGYSFFSQAISELGAIGAPSAQFVDPLFMLYNVLALLFGLGVLWIAVRRSRPLSVTGALLIAYGGVGIVTPLIMGPTFLKMAQRGVGTVGGDLPHIVFTAVLVLFLLIAIGFGAFAFGRRFRIYSFATLATVLVLGALTVPYANRLASGLPTPGLGMVERLDVYSLLAWIAVLAIVLLRQWHRPTRGARTTVASHVDGQVAPGFEEVRTEFERNFAERGEVGAAVAAYWRGEKVVDLWGGRRVPNGDAPWNEDTMVVVMSTTKGLAAMTLAVANARGWLDYDAPVARYWPEFAQNGKAGITVRQLLGHEAGLVLLDGNLTLDTMRDLDEVARVLARQKPAWPPGTRHGYHAMTLGLYMQEIIRRVDPEHRTLGAFFRDELAQPLGLDFHIGLPPEIPDSRLAEIVPLSRARGIAALTHSTPQLLVRILQPSSLLRRSLAIPSGLDFTNRRWLEVELPAGNGVGTARAIARAYSALAEGGSELGITPETFARVIEPPAVARRRDEVLGVPSYFSLGFLRPGPEGWFGSSPHALGAPGAGGSFGFADPDARLGFAYVMNKLDFHLQNDPREKRLRDAVYRAITRLGASRAASRSLSAPLPASAGRARRRERRAPSR